MLIFISAILYTVQLIVQQCNCLILIDLPQAYSAKWRLASRAPEMYEPYPRKRGVKSYLRRYVLGNDTPGNNIPSKVYRRDDADNPERNLKNTIKVLMDRTVQDVEEKMKEVQTMKPKTDEAAFKTGFTLSLVKKAREVLNELFNVAVKHKDQWQALEQLKIFEMIVNTNIDLNGYLKQLEDLLSGRNIHGSSIPTKPTDVNTTSTTIENNVTTSNISPE